MRVRRLLTCLLIILSVLQSLLSSPVWAAPVFTEARVADASDRAYEPIAIALIDQARHSVVVSMYLVRESEDARHPVNRLLQDLLEAAQRGVQVECYLNTRFRGGRPDAILDTPALRRLKAQGVRVIGCSANRRLHDKLLIVDDRYVLEGSTNWSIEALKVNWESNTLIDSPSLAKEKLARLHQLTDLPEASPVVRERRPPPPTMALPIVWITKGGVLPRLVVSRQERAFDTWLLLVREMAAQGRPEYFINLEELGLDVGLPAAWDDTATRRQMIKVLRELHDAVGPLMELHFAHGKDAWVRITVPAGPTVTIPANLLDPSALSSTPAAVTYLQLFELALQQQEGLPLARGPYSRSVPRGVLAQLTQRELSRRTGLNTKLLRRALRERVGTGT